MHPRFESQSDPAPELRIFDPIEAGEFVLRTPTDVDPEQSGPDSFPAPVSSAVQIETQTLEIPTLAACYIHTPDWEFVASTADDDPSLPTGEYVIELGVAPMKVYLSVESPVTVSTLETRVRIKFDGPTEVKVGARSFHDQPAGTITTTDDPEGAMKAISLFGSALKTTSPERSFPTLRGHPPLVEIGEKFDAPEGIERPDTGVRLELPPEYEYIYPATSLAYYLGAEIVPADRPRLVTDDGFEYDLAGPLGYEQTVGRVLRQTFFLDCVTRTEGYYQVDLHEREAVESVVDFDFADLYDRTLAERLEAYLSVPFEVVEDDIPTWPLTLDIVPSPEYTSMLSFAVDDLALVRVPPSPDEAELNEPADELVEFKRGVPAGEFTRAGSPRLEDVDETEIFTPRETAALDHMWVGEGYPLGANKATVESLRRRVERSAPEKTDIEIHVVCNDEHMKDEAVVEEFYGLRDLLQFDVSVHYELTTDELRDLLGQPADFLHYIGHVNEDGMQCADGHLDARTLEADEVGVRAVLLNACRSFAQGRALVEAGASAAVATLAELPNTRATMVGRALARLLNLGFPLQYATELVQQVVAGTSYLTIGDGGITLCQSRGGCPLLARVSSLAEEFELTLETTTVPSYGVGTHFTPNLDDGRHYLVPGEVGESVLTEEELDDYLNLELMPVVFEGDLFWSDELSASDLA